MCRLSFHKSINHPSPVLHRVLSFPTSFKFWKVYSIFSVLAQSSCLCCLNSGFTEVRFSCPSLKTENEKIDMNLLIQQNLSIKAVDSPAKHWPLNPPDSTHGVENSHVNTTTKRHFVKVRKRLVSATSFPKSLFWPPLPGARKKPFDAPACSIVFVLGKNFAFQKGSGYFYT